MANVQEVMLDSLLKASRAADQITPAVDRAKAFTELAKACAMALQTKGSMDMPTVEAPKETPKTAKRSAKKTAAPVAEEKKEEPAESKQQIVQASEAEQQEEQETTPEPAATEEKTPEQLEEEEYDFTTEWTPKACELLEKEISEVQRYFNMFQDDPEAFNSMVSAATEGVSTSIDTITPLNIRIVLQYIQALEAANNKGEE